MAVESFSSPPYLSFNLVADFEKPVYGRRIVIFGKSQLPVKKVVIADFKVKSSLRNQVFEDPSNGIICYEDDNGEIICEGFDEGPRVHDPVKPYNFRELNIIDIVPHKWMDVFNGVSEDVATFREKHACNGFHTSH